MDRSRGTQAFGSLQSGSGGGVSGGRDIGQEEAILGEEQEQSSRMGACLGGLNDERASCRDRRR